MPLNRPKDTTPKPVLIIGAVGFVLLVLPAVSLVFRWLEPGRDLRLMLPFDLVLSNFEPITLRFGMIVLGAIMFAIGVIGHSRSRH